MHDTSATEVLRGRRQRALFIGNRYLHGTTTFYGSGLSWTRGADISFDAYLKMPVGTLAGTLESGESINVTVYLDPYLAADSTQYGPASRMPIMSVTAAGDGSSVTFGE